MNAPNKTGRKCTVCGHPERNAIEAARSSGESFRAVALRFALSEDGLKRHMANHVDVSAEVSAIVAEVATFAPSSYVTMPLGQQIDTVIVTLSRMVERLQAKADQLERSDGYVVENAKGDQTIHPVVGELRQWVATWAQRVEAIQNLHLKRASVALEARRVALMRVALVSALDAAGVDPVARSAALEKMAEALERGEQSDG